MTKIDDEMVERAEAAFIRDFVKRGERFSTMHVRGLLEAALSPKPEPEIEVTEGMKQAGTLAMNRHTHDAPGIGWTVHFQNFAKAAVDIYRAMESTRLKEAAYAAKSAPQGVNAAAPVKETGGGVVRGMHSRKGEAGKWAYLHRRKDDPK